MYLALRPFLKTMWKLHFEILDPRMIFMSIPFSLVKVSQYLLTAYFCAKFWGPRDAEGAALS